ncbi:MAG: HEAT repeat domain-containing protein, partial [candidate division Zixibacteria bacterium]|nr:HEAT repeat domain-containing protein [candidate division Zixibacteria bacterium]
LWSQGETHESRHWFPCWDFPNDRQTSEMIVTIPDHMIAISNGELVDSIRNSRNQTIRFHWRENVAHVTYLTSLVVGEFASAHDTADGIPIDYYVPKRHRNKIELSFSKTPDMVRFFNDKIGVKYPYEKYAQVTVGDFRWGGMENISATTLTDAILHNERAHLDYQSDGLVAHELAHQWWGDLLTCKNWNHIWLNEGFATYFDALFVQHDRGQDEFTMKMKGNRDSYLGEDTSRYRRAMVVSEYENAWQMFDRHSYPKGAWILHMIRYQLGDELWWKSIKHYTETNYAKSVETGDFKRAIEETTGDPFDEFFDQWIYHGGHPEYDVYWSWNKNDNSVKLTIKQTQKVDSVTRLFTMPVEIAISGTFGTEEKRLDINQAEQTFNFTLPSRPTRVEFDPNDWILKNLTFKKEKSELIDQLANGLTVASRIRAAQWISKHSSKSGVIEAIENALRNDPFWGVRAEAATTLGKIRGADARSALIKGLNDTESRVRRSALTALGKFRKDEVAAKALERSFTSDLSYYARAQAVTSLAEIRAKNAYKTCLLALKQDSYRNVIRNAALNGFATLKDTRGIDHAFSWARYGQPQNVRTTAISVLAKLAKHDDKRKDDIRDELIDYLDDKYFRARDAATMALSTLGDPKAIPALERYKESRIRFNPMKSARDAIKNIRKKTGEKATIAELKSDLSEMKEENKSLKSQVEKLEERMKKVESTDTDKSDAAEESE